jgi:uncharacterized protein (DUF2384 family)
MKEFEIRIAKVVYRTTDEFKTEEEARTWAANKRDILRELIDDNAVEYFFEVDEVSNV